MKYPPYKFAMALMDYSIVYVSFIFSIKVYHEIRGINTTLLEDHAFNQVLFLAAYSLFAVFIIRYYQLYKTKLFLTRLKQIRLIFRSLLILVVGLAVVSFFTKWNVVLGSRLTILLFFITAFFLLSTWRVLLLKRVFGWFKVSGLFKIKIVILGENSVSKEFARRISRSPVFKLLGFIAMDGEQATGNTRDNGNNSHPVLGGLSDINKIMDRVKADELVIAYDGDNYSELLGIIDRCKDLKVRLYALSRLLNVVPEYVILDNYRKFSLVDISYVAPDSVSMYIKRYVDVLLSSVALIIFAPLFLVIAVLIKITSPGPVFYKQVRIGKDGVPFTFYKFRSMYMKSDEDKWRQAKTIENIRNRGKNNDDSTKVVNKSQITSVGKFLRKSSLDELPQLFNVLKGDMTLVGPRPCLPYEWEHYDKWHKKRMSVTPGCTGLWQVTGRSRVGFDDSVVLDLYYIYNKSLWLDFDIMFKTIPVMALGKGGE